MRVSLTKWQVVKDMRDPMGAMVGGPADLEDRAALRRRAALTGRLQTDRGYNFQMAANPWVPS